MPRIRLARGLGRRLRWSILGPPDDGPAAARARAPSTDLAARNVSRDRHRGKLAAARTGPSSASARRPAAELLAWTGEVADIGDYAQACWAVTAVAAPETSPASPVGTSRVRGPRQWTCPGQWCAPVRPRVVCGVAPGRVHWGTGRLVGPHVDLPSASARQYQHGSPPLGHPSGLTCQASPRPYGVMSSRANDPLAGSVPRPVVR